jgi:streptogramin lyase
MRHLLLLICLALCLSSRAAEIHTFSGTGAPDYSGDGGSALAAALRNPYGLCIGPDAALYICDMDNHVIRRIKDGEIATVAGTGKRGYSGDGGPAPRAELNEPYEVRFDSAGNMLFVEMRNNIVRKIDARTQNISTIAGNGTSGFSGDGGLATRAQLNQPHSIQLDPRDNLYICDIGNHRIRRVDLRTGFVSTFAGTGEKKAPRDGVKFSQEPLFGPRAIDFDREGNLWLALREGNAIYKLNLATGTIYHIAGTGEQGFKNGRANEATLSGPKGISVGSDQNIYFADTESHSIRRVNLQNGQVELVAGTGERGDGPDGDPLKCQFARPHGIFASRSGLIYVGDSENNRIRVISPGGQP